MNLVKSKLDPESLGIILLGPFLLEFFPDQVRNPTNTFYVFVCVCVRTFEDDRGSQKEKNQNAGTVVFMRGEIERSCVKVIRALGTQRWNGLRAAKKLCYH